MMANLINEVGDKSRRSKKPKRFEELSVRFENGSAVDWFMAVGECFRTALDIQLTERVKPDPQTGKKRKELGWTEGSPCLYTFSTGDVMHRAKNAQDGKWGETLSKVKVTLQVKKATPDKLAKDGVKISGRIVVCVYRPATDGSRLERCEDHPVTQDEFVQILKTGNLPDGSKLIATQ